LREAQVARLACGLWREPYHALPGRLPAGYQAGQALSPSQVAAALLLSPETVRLHLWRARRKLRLSSREELLRALQNFVE
jgi:hypothetical protein